MDIELRHVRYFVAVAEERHFGLAAKRLHMSQPPLSRQIHNLEEAIGAELIDRSTRPIHLTEAGTAFLEEARFLLEQSRRAIDRSRRTAAGEHGYLAVAGLRWAYDEILPRTVRIFSARFPDVRLELSIREAADQTDAVEKQWVDVGFTRPMIETRAIRVETLLDERLVAVVPARSKLARRDEVALEDLVREPFITVSEQIAPGFAFQQGLELSRRNLTPKILHEAPDPSSQLAMIAAGLGVGLHLSASPKKRDRGVAFVPVEGEMPTAPLALLWRRNDNRELVRSFIETAKTAAKELEADG